MGPRHLTYGPNMDVETTAFTALAMMKAGTYGSTVQKALDWIIKSKGAACGWSNTQATVMALRALLGAAKYGVGGAVGTLAVSVDGKQAASVALTEETSQTLQYVDLAQFAAP